VRVWSAWTAGRPCHSAILFMDLALLFQTSDQKSDYSRHQIRSRAPEGKSRAIRLKVGHQKEKAGLEKEGMPDRKPGCLTTAGGKRRRVTLPAAARSEFWSPRSPRQQGKVGCWQVGATFWAKSSERAVRCHPHRGDPVGFVGPSVGG